MHNGGPAYSGFSKNHRSQVENTNMESELIGNIRYHPVSFDPVRLHDVCVSHVDPDGTFHCQLLQNAPDLDDLMCDLQHCQTERLPRPSEGQTCLVKCSDNLLYRGNVVSNAGSSVHVKLVDFGAVENLPVDRVYHLSDRHAAFPVQAIRCCLYVESDPQTLAAALQMYESKVPLVVKFLFKTGQVWEVELTDTSKETDIGFSDIANSVKLSNTDRTVRTAGTMQGAGISRSQQVGTADIPRPDVRQNSVETLFVTAVLSSTEFFGQLTKNAMENLDNLQAEMQTYYTSSSSQPLQRYEEGVFCSAAFSEDDQFYRSKIIKVATDEVQVSFVDYGNQEIKLPRDCLQLPPQFCSLPQQGIACTISPHYTGLTKEKLEDVVLNKDIQVKVESCAGDVYTVSVATVSENESILISLQRYYSSVVLYILSVHIPTYSKSHLHTIMICDAVYVHFLLFALY